MAEKTIVNAIIRYLKSLDRCFCFKEHGGIYGTSGLPDVICCYKGRFVGFEVKTAKGKASEIQKYMIRKINDAEGVARVVRSVGEVKKILGELEGELYE